MMWRSVQVSVVFVFAAVLAACGGASVATAAPTAPPTVSPSPSPSPVPSPTAASRASAPVTVATAKPGKPRASAGPQPSSSPDIAAMIEASAAQFSATIRLLDLADGDVAVTVAFIDPSSGPPSPLGTYTISPSGRQSDAVPPGTYRLVFLQSGSTTGPTCTITLAKGGVYTFVVVPGAIAVSRAGYTPTTTADLFVPSSTLCQK